jgi:SAM-dependent methyltransferase
MINSVLGQFQDVGGHEAVAAIVRRHSTNPADIRDIALDRLDPSSLHRVLELGCGFGFMSGQIAARIAADGEIIGVDAWPGNEEPFIQSVTRHGRRAAFQCLNIESTLHWPDDRFDLVVCCYCLYFFPEVLPEIARVLDPHGQFIAVTHSEHAVADQLADAGFRQAGDALLALAHRFSAENGQSILDRHFEWIERIDYPNALRFEAGDVEDLLTYLRFKAPLLARQGETGLRLPAELEAYIHDTLASTGEIVIQKDDAVFRCRRPRWP